MARPKKNSYRDPSYRLHKASGQAIVTFSGKTEYLGKYGSDPSRELYARLLAEWHARGRTSPTAAKHELTMSEMILGFLEYAEKRYAGPNTLNTYRLVFKTTRRLYGDLPAAQFGPLRFRAVRDELLRMKATERYGGKPYARSYINHSMYNLIHAFRWAESREMIPAGMCHGLREVEPDTSAPEAPRVQPAVEEVIEATIPFLMPMTAAMVRLQMYTGMRPGEVCALKMSELDLKGDEYGNWIFAPKHHKTAHHGHVRCVAIGKRGQDVLRPYLWANPEAYIFSPRRNHRAWVASRREPVVTAMLDAIKLFADRQFSVHDFASATGLKAATKGRFWVDVLLKGEAIRLVRRGVKSAIPALRRPSLYVVNPEPDIQRVIETRSDRWRVNRRKVYRYGERYRTQTYDEAIRRAAQRADLAAHKLQPEVPADQRIIPHWAPNQIRHKFATEMRAKFTPDVASVALGHSRIQTTDNYARPNMRAVGQAIAEVG